MTHITLIWLVTVSALLVFFVFRGIQKFRKETGHSKLLEWDRGENIHYANDDDDM